MMNEVKGQLSSDEELKNNSHHDEVSNPSVMLM